MTLAAAIPAGAARLRIPEVRRGRLGLQPRPRVRVEAARERRAWPSPPALAPGHQAAAREPQEPLREATACRGEPSQEQPGLWEDQVKVEPSPEPQRHCLVDLKRPLLNHQALIEEQEPLVQLLRQNLATSDEGTVDPTPGKDEPE